MLSAADMPAGPGGCSQAVCYAHRVAALGIFHALLGTAVGTQQAPLFMRCTKSPGASAVSGT